MSLRLPLIFLSLLGCGLVKIVTSSGASLTTEDPAQTSPTEVTVTSPATPVTASTPPVVPVDPKLYWVILHAENPSGQAGGQPCSIFDFAGVQCSLSFDYSLKSGNDDPISNTTVFSPGNSADSTSMSSLSTPLSGSFQGFTINGTLKAGDQTVATFDPFTVSTLTKGVMTLSDPVSGASVRFAWKSDLNPATTAGPTTTPPSTTPPGSTTTTTRYTGPSTSPTPTPVPTYPRDCEEVTDRTDGVKSIFINKDKDKKVDVYCQFGSSGALTTIQSRGNDTLETLFGDDFDVYKAPFGKAGPNNNYWFGLENMNLLTAGNVSYNLLIEVCCNGASTKQIYERFTIGNASTTYTLNAMADSAGIGLDLIAVGGTNEKDIGRPFSTKNTISATGLNLDDCEILQRWDDSATGSGGWWFGSCANNLNGKYHASTTLNATCAMALGTTTPVKDTGIELRTTTGIIDEPDGFFADLVSYTRVRMAVYRSTTQLQGISGFCST